MGYLYDLYNIYYMNYESMYYLHYTRTSYYRNTI